MSALPLLCPRCQSQVHERWPYCARCGSRLGDTNPPVPAIPVCENCGAAVDATGAFCWKCGVPLATGRQPLIPAPPDDANSSPSGPGLPAYETSSARVPAAPDRRPYLPSTRVPTDAYGAGSRRGSRGRSTVVIVILVAAVAALAFLWVSPYGEQVLGRPGTVRITSLAYDPVYQGTASGYFPSGGQGSPCGGGCTLSPATGSTFELLLLLPNTGSSAHTISSISISSPFSLEAEPIPATVPAGEVWLQGLLVVAPSSAGSYSVTVTFDTT